VKTSPTADYPVQVLRQEWEEEPSPAHLYAGAFAVTLNYLVHVAFIKDVSAVAPPWDVGWLSKLSEESMTAEQAQVVAALSASYVVTPNEELAGTDDGFTWPADGGPEADIAVFYVAPEEYVAYASDLDALTEIVSDAYPDKRVSDLRDYGVIDFIERRVVASPRLRQRHAVLLGQAR
jgi:hypothetical protein